MNPTQKFYDSYDKNNIVLKLTNSYYHNKNVALIRNRKDQFKEPKKSIHQWKPDPMYKFRVEKDNEELCGKIKDISNRKPKQFDNSFFNSYRRKLAICKKNRRKEIQEEIDKENEEMYKRFGIAKPFISSKQLDSDFNGEHKIIVKKLRRVDADGTVVLPKIYTNPMLNSRNVKTEESKEKGDDDNGNEDNENQGNNQGNQNENDDGEIVAYTENLQIDNKKHETKDVKKKK